MKQLSILMIGAYKPISGGIANVVENISINLKKKNKNVTVITHEVPNAESDLGHWIDHDIDIFQEKILFSKRFTSFQILFQTAKRAFLLRKKVNIFHIHGPFYSGIGFLDNKTPLVITFHGYSSLESVLNGRIKLHSILFKLLRWLEKKIVKRANAIIVVDSSIRNWCLQDLGCNSNKLFLISNGVDCNKFSINSHNKTCMYLFKKYHLLSSKRIIVCIRRFSPKNGVKNVLLGYIEYAKKNNTSNDIFILAGGGPLKNEFKNIIKKNKLDKRIILEDEIAHDEVINYYSSADIIINSFTHIPFVKEFPVKSVKEALENGYPICTSLTTLEALSVGKPVILSTVGGKYHKIDFNDYGIITSDKNPKEIADAIQNIFLNYELAKKMGLNARAYIEKNRDWSKVTTKVEAVYEIILRQVKS